MSNRARRRRAARPTTPFVVECYRSTDLDDTNLLRDGASFLLDQRAFGPRRMLVFFADTSGRMHYMTHCPRLADETIALECSIDTVLSKNAAALEHVRAAVVYNDEPVAEEMPDNLGLRFAAASEVFRRHGIRLVDWWMCDDQVFRSMHYALHPEDPWWPWPVDESAA